VSGRHAGLLTVLATIAAAGCAAHQTMYGGARRSSGEVAVVETKGTVIIQVDEGAPGTYSQVEVLPGLRALLLTVRSSQDAISVCFVARPGHTYTVRPVYGRKTWRAEVIDQNTTELVRTDGFSAENEQCTETEGTRRPAHRRPTVVPQ
jgi:hypothetical protein